MIYKIHLSTTAGQKKQSVKCPAECGSTRTKLLSPRNWPRFFLPQVCFWKMRFVFARQIGCPQERLPQWASCTHLIRAFCNVGKNEGKKRARRDLVRSSWTEEWKKRGQLEVAKRHAPRNSFLDKVAAGSRWSQARINNKADGTCHYCGQEGGKSVCSFILMKFIRNRATDDIRRERSSVI